MFGKCRINAKQLQNVAGRMYAESYAECSAITKTGLLELIAAIKSVASRAKESPVQPIFNFQPLRLDTKLLTASNKSIKGGFAGYSYTPPARKKKSILPWKR
jgi:hypothetical protein